MIIRAIAGLLVLALHLAILYGLWSEWGGEKIYDVCGLRNGDLLFPILSVSAITLICFYIVHFFKRFRWTVWLLLVPFWAPIIYHYCG
jgi:hypothetical protein